MSSDLSQSPIQTESEELIKIEEAIQKEENGLKTESEEFTTKEKSIPNEENQTNDKSQEFDSSNSQNLINPPRRYYLGNQIGGGAFGIIYNGFDQKLQIQVCIQEIDGSQSSIDPNNELRIFQVLNIHIL
jgi:hypothetical protein